MRESGTWKAIGGAVVFQAGLTAAGRAERGCLTTILQSTRGLVRRFCIYGYAFC